MASSGAGDRQVLPIFQNGEMPARERARSYTGARGFALLTLALTFVYLWWRAGSGTIDLSVWWVALPLFAAEVHNFVGLSLFTAALWRTDVVRAPRRKSAAGGLTVAVVLPTFNEPQEVLLPAIAAAVVLKPEHETWVLDDGGRPEIRELAESLGARYLAREAHDHAKAGNVNHALPYIKADVIAFLDADYVALPGFLERTLPYFEDPRVAIVQTPQDFYNVDSFEHEPRDEGWAFSEEGVFYRMIGPGKNAWGGVFWCGTCALVRAEALRDVGGVATDTITEDIHTTIRMHRRGWKSIYHNEVLARGLAPSDAVQYLKQRNRWAIGAMQVLRVENPLFASGLRLRQRLSYATTLFAWFDAWRTLAYLALPALVLFSGASPIDAPGYIYGPFFGVVFLTQLYTQRLLARGYYDTRLSLVFEVLRMPAILPATFAVLAPRRNRKFQVTSKGRAEGRDRVPVPWLLPLLLAANVGGLGWAAATLAGLTPVTYRHPAAVLGAAVFAMLGSSLLFMALRRIRAPRYSGERRNSVRFPVFLTASVDGEACRVIDLSVTGAQVDLPAAQAQSGEDPMLVITGPDGVVTLRTSVRRRIPTDEGRVEVGLEFEPGQHSALAQVSLWLFTYTAGRPPTPLVGFPVAA